MISLKEGRVQSREGMGRSRKKGREKEKDRKMETKKYALRNQLCRQESKERALLATVSLAQGT